VEDRIGDGRDWDEAGSSNWTEYHASTIPTNEASLFELISVEASSDAVVTWSSESGKTYTLWTCTNLFSGVFEVTVSDIPATAPLNSYTSSVDGSEAIYIRLTVDKEVSSHYPHKQDE
jgi:hypothetical protein